MNRTRIAYRKTFTTGRLRGLSHDASISVPTTEAPARLEELRTIATTGRQLRDALTGAQYTIANVEERAQ